MAASASEPGPTAPSSSPSDKSTNSSTPAGTESSGQTAQALQQKYFTTQDPNERSEIVYALGELNSTEAIAVLGLLFQNERDEKVKLDILATVQQMKVMNASAMSIVAAAARPEQPQQVREAAIDALAYLEEPGARCQCCKF
jgi:PBS lyase HEAT-like repeat